MNSNLGEKPKKLLLTVKEVAVMLNIGKSTVYAYVNSGIIKPVILPRVRPSTAVRRNKNTLRFKPEEIDNFLKSL